jgi:hypothetical protein
MESWNMVFALELCGVHRAGGSDNPGGQDVGSGPIARPEVKLRSMALAKTPSAICGLSLGCLWDVSESGLGSVCWRYFVEREDLGGRVQDG